MKKWNQTYLPQRSHFSAKIETPFASEIPAGTKEELVGRLSQARLSPGIARLDPELILAKGEGDWVTSTDGRKILDFTSGFAVTNTGHCHPKIVAAIQKQAQELLHAQVNIGISSKMVELMDQLCTILPPPLHSFFFWNSGAEAVEASIKLARHATGKQNIIVFDGSFHGRTFGGMSLTTSKSVIRAGYGPLLSGITVAPYPYCHHCPVSRVAPQTHSIDNCCFDALDKLELIFKTRSAPSETAAVLIEPILGEGGYVIPPKGFLKRVKQICQEKGVLMILDEVQTGFGRTGKFFAFEHFGFVPDILVMAKGLASGMPLSCIASSFDLMKTQPPGSMGGTFAGNPISCASAVATIKVMKEENMLENATQRGKELKEMLQELKEMLQELQRKYPSHISDVRGLGLMVGVELKNVPSGVTSTLSKQCLKNGLLLLSASVYETMRFMPSLRVSSGDIQRGVEIFEKSLKEVVSKV